MDDIVSILKHDGVGVIPTDTLYGIIGGAFSKRAVERIYEIKGRDEGKPFIILISSLSDLKKFGIELDAQQKKFLKAVWPGPVSVILPCAQKSFSYLHRGHKSLAFRMPKNALLEKLLKKTGPLVAPSANPQSKKPAETIQDAQKYFGEAVDFYSGSVVKKGNPSTIISFQNGKLEILREGAKKIPKGLLKQ